MYHLFLINNNNNYNYNNNPALCILVSFWLFYNNKYKRTKIDKKYKNSIQLQAGK